MTINSVGTPVKFVLPPLGESVEEATISRWLKQPGDHVIEGEPLIEVATDKVDTEVPATFSGTLLEILAKEDALVGIGAELAVIDQAGESAEAARQPEQETAHKLKPAPHQQAVPEQQPAPILFESARAPQENGLSSKRHVKLSQMRRVIADRMMESLHNTAQLTSVVEVDVTSVIKARQRHNEQGQKISYFPFFVAATIKALQEQPVFNTTISEDGREVIYYDAVHLGIAVDSPKGLLVPVIRDAHLMNTKAISIAVADVAARVRSGEIKREELSGGTFTITNTGSRGSLFDTPILNHPQTAILGTGAIVERVVPVIGEGLQFGVRSFAFLSLTYDHRIVDGADAAGFLTRIKRIIETKDLDDLE